MTEVRLSRAELGVAVLEMQGWKHVEALHEYRTDAQNRPLTDNYLLAPNGERRYVAGLTEAAAWKYLSPDPTREIGAAWALLPLVETLWNSGNEEMRERAFGFELRWGNANLHSMTAEEAATWICCHVYEAVTGARAVLVGDDE